MKKIKGYSAIILIAVFAMLFLLRAPGNVGAVVVGSATPLLSEDCPEGEECPPPEEGGGGGPGGDA